VAGETASVWQAPPIATAVGEPLPYRVAGMTPLEPPIEAGRVVAGPHVVARSPAAVVVLDRLTVIDSLLSLELTSLIRGAGAAAMVASMSRPARIPPTAEDTGDRIRADGPGATAAILRDGYAYWSRPQTHTGSGGDDVFESTAEFVFERLESEAADLVVAWPAAGIPDVRVSITTG
jgi:hypothetical protein